MLGFGAIGVNPVGIGPRGGQTTTTLVVTAGAYALSGNAATFTLNEAVAAGSYALTGVSISFTVKEAVSAGAYALTGQAATFLARENVTAGSYLLNGVAITEETFEAVQSGSYTLTGNPVLLTRTGADFDLKYGGIGHYLVEVENAKQLARITRKTPQPIDRTTKPQFAPIGSPPSAAPAPVIDLQAAQNERMAAQQQAAAQAATIKRRREEEAILLLAC